MFYLGGFCVLIICDLWVLPFGRVHYFGFSGLILRVSTYPLKLPSLSIFLNSSVVRALSWNAQGPAFEPQWEIFFCNFITILFLCFVIFILASYLMKWLLSHVLFNYFLFSVCFVLITNCSGIASLAMALAQY